MFQARSVLRELAQRYNIGRSTVRKWKYWQTTADRSHWPHRLRTTLSTRINRGIGKGSATLTHRWLYGHYFIEP
ncbi:hypothetical protein [Nitrococcus mobilis]|uniref:Uncharacterized protein n=1 Tax=Nitrococcus mobilis Nb-231 TaxID=314278 RepID=A4BTV6_9GAMM|nr:hypothetical protein [Nitrococcus mobilis]EAR20920.1 hypothetical protein NB231_04057 [Nitrococcus mobilis Nb-231]